MPNVTQAVSWFPIVPCGLNQQPAGIAKSVHDYTQPCNQCLLIELGKNVIDFTFFWIVPVIGTLFIIWAGFLILWGGKDGNPAAVTEGRKMLTQVAIGIAIILGSWLITNFILKTIAGSDTIGAKQTPWYQIECTVTTLKQATNNAAPPRTPPTGGGTPSTPSPSSTPTPTRTPTPTPSPSSTGAQCLQTGLNLCQGASSAGCANSSCSQYAAMIARQTTGVATVNVLKAFMEIESSCNIKSVTGTSYGLMQMTPPIPQMYASRCGVSASVVNKAWLTNPANAEKSICISAQWINAVAASQCGSSIRNLYAGYNGGASAKGACGPSVSCAGEKSCSNEPVKRWECLYNDTAHKSCNGGNDIFAGYNQTRLGATKIQYCATNPGF